MTLPLIQYYLQYTHTINILSSTEDATLEPRSRSIPLLGIGGVIARLVGALVFFSFLVHSTSPRGRKVLNTQAIPYHVYQRVATRGQSLHKHAGR